MMNISSKDRILNKYNNLNNNLFDKRMQYLQNNNSNYFNSNTYNYYNTNKFNNSHFNDSDLQNRITNSLYPNRNQKISLRNYNPFHKSFLINQNNDLNFRTNQLQYNNIIEDFKTTLMKTQNLTNEIMNKSNYYKNIGSHNLYYHPNNYNTFDSDISNNSLENENLSEENGSGSSINLDDLSDDLNNLVEQGDDDYKYKLNYNKNKDNKLNLLDIKKDNLNFNSF